MEPGRLQFKFLLSNPTHWLTDLTSYLTFLCLRFLICEMRMMTWCKPFERIKWVNPFKTCRPCLGTWHFACLHWVLALAFCEQHCIKIGCDFICYWHFSVTMNLPRETKAVTSWAERICQFVYYLMWSAHRRGNNGPTACFENAHPPQIIFFYVFTVENISTRGTRPRILKVWHI